MINDTHTNLIEKAELVYSGDDYFSRLINIIKKAQFEIHLQTYIFENDSTGLEIASLLKEAAHRKVKVYLLFDGYGSRSLSNHFLKALIKEGIYVRLFSPWHSKNNFYLGRRLHHKVVVADAKIALIGGINIANKYRGSILERPWLDFAVQIEDQSINFALQQLCKDIYFKKQKIKRKKIQSNIYKDSKSSIKVLINDWVKHSNEIYKAYMRALRKVDKEIIIVGSYFLPGRKLSMAIKDAASRGVKVTIILSGISDVPIVMRAAQYFYSTLLKHNIEIVEWKESVLHGKLAVADSKWATIGSFNLNHLSSYGSIEMNVEINSQEFSKNLFYHLIEIIKNCEKITLDTLKIRNGIFTKVRNWFAYRLVRIALIIATYIPYKRLLKLY